jgi:hypothetical protein
MVLPFVNILSATMASSGDEMENDLEINAKKDKKAKKAAKRAREEEDLSTGEVNEDKKEDKKKSKKDKKDKQKDVKESKVVTALLTPEEKAAIAAAKNERRAQKMETLSAEEIEQRRLRAERIKERELAKKERQKAKKGKPNTVVKTKTPPPPAKKKKVETDPQPIVKKVSAGGPVINDTESREASRARQLAETEHMDLSEPYEVFLKYLPPDASEDQVSNFFDGCGEFEPPKLMRCHATGRVIRGFVVFKSKYALRQVCG